MKIRAKCPASCGELIQGWIDDGEKLVSYPINWYSEVTIEPRIKENTNRYNPKFHKAWKAYLETCRYFDVPEKEIPAISLDVSSTIPVAKGMASSTADIAATVAATAHMLGVKMPPALLAKICLSMEATDSTIFPTLTLFDHLRGERIEESHWSPEFQVLVLEPDDILITEEYRKKHKSIKSSNIVSHFQKAYQKYQQAIKLHSLELLGQAATLSARAHQMVLQKKRFEELLELKEKLNLLGVNVAHSGTVVGIMYDETAINREELLNYFEEKKILDDYPHYHFHKSVSGGVSINED